MDFGDCSLLWLGRTLTKGSSSKLIGISIVENNNDEVVVTTSEETLLYNIRTKKCIKNWTYRQGSVSAITVSAARHPISGRLYSVRGENSKLLITWDDSTDSLLQNAIVKPNCRKCPIHSVYVHKKLGLNGLYLYNDGHVGLYDEKLELVAEMPCTEKSTVLWASFCMDMSKNFTVLIMLLRKENGELEVQICKVSQESSDVFTPIIKYPISLPTEESSFVSADWNASTSSLSILWSNGVWQIYTFHRQSGQLCLSKPPVSRIHNLPLKNPEMERKTKKRKIQSKLEHALLHSTSCVASVGSSLSVILFVNNMDVSLWNSDYGILMKGISVEGKKGDQEFNVTQLGRAKGVIFSRNDSFCILGYENGVVILPIHPGNVTLCSIVGTVPPSLPPSSKLPLIEANIPEDKETWSERLLVSNVSEEEVIKELTDIKTTKEFVALFMKYFSSQKSISHRFIIEMAKRCVQDAALQLWNPLAQLIQTRRLSSRSCPQLISTLIAHNQISLLGQCLSCILDLSETHKVEMLHYFISKVDFLALKTYKKTKDKTAIQAIEYMVNRIIVLPKNDVFLQSALKRLSMVEVLFLLTFLNKRFQLVSQSDLSHQELKNIISWISIVLDAHFTDLVLHSSSDKVIQTLLTDLKQKIYTTIDNSERISSLQGLLSHYIKQAKLPVVQLADYSIEVLHLK